MILTEIHIQKIEQSIESRGIQLSELIESMTDHVCCQIENSDHNDFEKAFNEAMQEFNQDEMKEVELDIQWYDQFRKYKRSKRWLYSLGFLSAFLIITGILFKQMHWPTANFCLVTGVFFLNFGFLPLYFYERYKESVKLN